MKRLRPSLSGEIFHWVLNSFICPAYKLLSFWAFFHFHTTIFNDLLPLRVHRGAGHSINSLPQRLLVKHNLLLTFSVLWVPMEDNIAKWLVHYMSGSLFCFVCSFISKASLLPANWSQGQCCSLNSYYRSFLLTSTGFYVYQCWMHNNQNLTLRD